MPRYAPATLSIDLGNQPPLGRLAWIQLLAFLQALVRPKSEFIVGGLAPSCPVRALVERGVFTMPGTGSPVFREHVPKLCPTEAFATGSGAELLSRKLLLQCDRIHLEPSGLPLRINPSVYSEVQRAAWLHHQLEQAAQAINPTQGSAQALRFLSEREVAPRRVTLITSVFRGDPEIQAFLANVAALQGYEHDEHLLIRPGSPGHEHEALLAHVRRWPSALYVNLPEDPGLYEVWNFGARLATAKYLSNANLDDRRAPEQLAVLVEELERHPECAIASTAMRVSDDPGIGWEQSEGLPLFFGNEKDQTYGPQQLLRNTPEGVTTRALPHCMPIWRRELHGRYGYFNETFYGPSSDIEFWLRAGSQGERFRFLQRPLGLFRRDPASYWHRNPDSPRYRARIVAKYGALFREPNAIVALTRTKLPSRQIAELRSLLVAGAGFEAMAYLLHLSREAGEGDAESGLASLLSRIVRRHFGVTALDITQLVQRMRLTEPGFTHHHVLVVVSELLDAVMERRRNVDEGSDTSALHVLGQAVMDVEVFALPVMVVGCRGKLVRNSAPVAANMSDNAASTETHQG